MAQCLLSYRPMMHMNSTLTELLQIAEENVLPVALKAFKHWLSTENLPGWMKKSLVELLELHAWDEINDRFYKTISFGTGGLRGRTIGKVVPQSEHGSGGLLGAPQHAAIGNAYFNELNLIKATVGLYRYAEYYLQQNERSMQVPKLVVAHDVRHFSKLFSGLVARVWEKLGGIAYVFDGPRSTPQLSFSVRHLKCIAGGMITASHNPPHDNGFKVYFEDGGQVVDPHARGISEAGESFTLEEAANLLQSLSDSPLRILPESLDHAYHRVLRNGLLDEKAIATHSPTVVYSPLHGTGQVAILPLLEAVGAHVVPVENQCEMDGRFPTVKSPNPENPEAFEEAIAVAKRVQADVVLATDPDADRMGIAIPVKDGSYQCLTGNQIGALLLEYRLRSLKKHGWIPQKGSDKVAFIKTFVTTPLQEAIAGHHGVKVIQTLTGFKWIGAKLRSYENLLQESLLAEEGMQIDYDATTPRKRAELLQRYSTFYAFGGEESYGTLFSDEVRDKDANGAALLFTELVADLKSKGQTVEDFLNEIYLQYGYYEENLINIVCEGADGFVKIQKILTQYKENPPVAIGSFGVERFMNFNEPQFHDADGDRIPTENFFFLQLRERTAYAVRASGTEPKIKFYCFTHEPIKKLADLPEAQEITKQRLKNLSASLQTL